VPDGDRHQREDLRAKFTGTPELVERFVLAIAEDVRRELVAIWARSIGEIIGEAGRVLREARSTTIDLGPVLRAPRWSTTASRRADPASAASVVVRQPASAVEASVLSALVDGGRPPTDPLVVTTAERSVGAAISGAIERRELSGPVRLAFRGAAGQSFGAFATAGVRLTLEGVANDYVGKGLSGGVVVVRPEPDLAASADRSAIAGNTCLFGATAGRLHVVGRAGMRFAVRNSGAAAVVEGIGAHGCEYMTGGTVVVLGQVGANFGAGMTGGRAFICDATATLPTAVDTTSVTVVPLDRILEGRDDGEALLAELADLVLAHAEAGSALAGRLMALGGPDPRTTWVVEPRRAQDLTVMTVERARPGLPVESAASQGRATVVAGPVSAAPLQAIRHPLAGDPAAALP
jgi:glutamate synthase domain-containing protein 3